MTTLEETLGVVYGDDVLGGDEFFDQFLAEYGGGPPVGDEKTGGTNQDIIDDVSSPDESSDEEFVSPFIEVNDQSKTGGRYACSTSDDDDDDEFVSPLIEVSGGKTKTKSKKTKNDERPRKNNMQEECAPKVQEALAAFSESLQL